MASTDTGPRLDIDVVLYEPEIPPNTGNVIRLCANTGARLHLIEPLGFTLDDRQLRRAGLDYHEYADVAVHATIADYLRAHQGGVFDRVFAFTTRAERTFDSTGASGRAFQPGDGLLFGPETRGLPDAVLGAVPEPNRLRIAMRPQSRSLNLANAVAVAVYGVWREFGYAGAT